VASQRTEALILRIVDYGESDRICHLLIPDGGRQSAIARSARRSVRRFSGTLDLFNHLDVQIDRRRPGAMARLEQARLIETFTPLRTDSTRFALGCYLLELLGRLAPEGGTRADTRRLFHFALAALRAIATLRPDTRLRTILELRALDALGLRPELRRCVRCGEAPTGTSELDFHIADGGPVCSSCSASLEGLMRVHLGTLRALEQWLRFDMEHVDRLVLGPHAIAEARGLLGRFQRYHLGIELRSERILDGLLGPPTA
jgi:DNA repair protein RecO (recombination protein O)